MSDIWQSLKKRYEHTFVRTQSIPNVCRTLDIDRVKDLVEHAANQTKRAKTVTAFANSAVELGKAGEKLDQAAEKLNKLTEKSNSILGDFEAACDISEAVSILNNWNTPNSTVTNEEAAKAFDKLFGGVADYFEKLPPPVNSYAKVLAEIGRTSFFSNMQALMDPTNPRNSEGRQLQDLERSGDL
jgi:hypothetical protein